MSDLIDNVVGPDSWRGVVDKLQGAVLTLEARVAELEALCADVKALGVIRRYMQSNAEPIDRNSPEWKEWARNRAEETPQSVEVHRRLDAVCRGEAVEGRSGGQAIEPTKERP